MSRRPPLRNRFEIVTLAYAMPSSPCDSDLDTWRPSVSKIVEAPPPGMSRPRTDAVVLSDSVDASWRHGGRCSDDCTADLHGINPRHAEVGRGADPKEPSILRQERWPRCGVQLLVLGSHHMLDQRLQVLRAVESSEAAQRSIMHFEVGPSPSPCNTLSSAHVRGCDCEAPFPLRSA